MPRTHRAIHQLVPLIRKQPPPISKFRLSREDNHCTKSTFSKPSNPHPLRLAVLIAGQYLGESADEVILRGHEHHLLPLVRLQSLGWMSESDRDYFLPAIRGGDEILFGTAREAEKRFIV